MNDLFAAVDLGSNSFRLLVARIKDGVICPVDQIRETVRLAGGFDLKNNLQAEVQTLALNVLNKFHYRLSGFKQKNVQVVGTSALRIAQNKEKFLVNAEQVLGFPIKVISGIEEARLTYIGATRALEFSDAKRLVIDIGGGSSEFIIGSGYTPIVMESVAMGCVFYSNHYFPYGEFKVDNFANAIMMARTKILSIKHLFNQHNWNYVLGTSGSAKSIYKLCKIYKFTPTINLNALYQLKDFLISQKNFKGLTVVNLKEDRKAILAGGLAIMIAAFEELNIKEMELANGSLREGLLYDLFDHSIFQDSYKI